MENKVTNLELPLRNKKGKCDCGKFIWFVFLGADI